MRTLTIKPYLAIILSLAWSIAGVQAQFNFDHIGTGATGSITPNAEPGSFTLIGGGDDIWSANDNFDFAHTTVTGDFDIRVRVQSLEFTATWTKAGIMARESLLDNSRMAFNRVTPQEGANDTRFAYRTGTSAPALGEHEDGSGSPGYPNAWLRLVRAGNVFTAYATTDGLNWREQGRQDTAGWEGGAVSAALEVGLGVSRHSGADPLATCEFRDYGNAVSTPAAISTQPANTTAEEGFTATLKFSAPGGFDLYNIQWRKNGVDIAGATSPTYTTPVLAGTDTGTAYSVAIRQKNNGTTATSADAILTVVPDTTKPTVTSIGITAGIANRVVVVFSEPVNKADAESLANYTLSGATASAAALQADNKTVYIATSPLTTSGCKNLAVHGIRDRASVPNTMDPANQSFIYADGVLRYQEYQNIGNGTDNTPTVDDLTSAPAFPNSPNRTVFVTAPENPNGGGGEGDNYGGRVVGYVTAPVTGDYRFYMASDDGGALYLSTDDNPANKVLIASEPVWNNFRDYIGTLDGGALGRRPGCAGVGTSESCENISTLINLQCGNRYYIEGLYKEGGGGDHISVAWQKPGDPIPTGPIPSAYLSPLNPAAITLAANLPADTTISENQNLILTINITGGTPSWVITWFKNGTPIPGATDTTFRIDNAKIPDSGTYSVTVQNSLGVVTSRSANVNIIVDTVPPSALTAIAPAGNGTQFDVLFSEPINQTDAQNIANYSLPGVTLASAALQADTKTVRITTSSTLYTPGCKSLTVNNVRDRAIPPNTLMNGSVGVVAAKGSIRYMQYNGISGVVPANLTSSPKFPNSADRILNLPDFENPGRSAGEGDNYGTLFQGFVHPPVTGPYIFYCASDDGSALWLSTDENPANKVQIAAEPIWSNYRTWTGSGAGGGGRVCPSPTTCNNSAPINLQAGCKYFVEYIQKEGGGGDFGSVTWSLPGAPAPANGSATIPGTFLSPYEVAANVPAGQPADITETQGRIVTFTANITGSPNLAIQWYKNGAPITGANGNSVTVGPLAYPGDDGATFYVTAINNLGTATSRTATLHVIQDLTPPSAVAAAGSTTLDRATITFNEIIQSTSADPFNFTITGGSVAPAVVGATLSTDGKTVLLTLDPATPLELDTAYTVSAFGIADFAGNAQPETSANFHSAVEGCGGVIFEAYNAGGGNLVDNLRSYSGFPNSPDFTMVINGMDSRIAYPTDAREAYGARLRGVYVPPYSGRWIFYLRSDDGSELWLNPNGIDPAGKQKVQTEAGCCEAFEALPTQPFDLIGGHPYYMEALYKEGTGGDYVQVAARIEGSADPLVPIGAHDLGQFAEPGFSGTLTLSGPGDQSVAENRPVTFSVNATSSAGLPICYQWFRDGAPITGANAATYSFTPAYADNGAVFTMRASIVGNVVNSPAATLTVVPDLEGPKVLSASGSDTFRLVTVKFDELLDAASAGDPFNYEVSGLTVDGAVLLSDGKSVQLTTSQQTPGATYTVTVSGVKDASVHANVVDPAHNSAHFTAFTFNCGLLVFEAYNDIGGVAVSDLTSNPAYPLYPSEVRYLNTFDTVAVFGTTDYRNNFGGRVHGVFIPPASGNWIFYLRSDDASELNLNPNGIDPEGKVQIAAEPACCGPFSAHPSAPQALVAGQQYFIEGIYKEGGGGDYIQVAAKLDTDATNPDSLAPIGASAIGIYAGASGAPITLSQDISSQTVCINPLVPEVPTASFTVGVASTPLHSDDFNSGNGGYTVTTDTAFAGPWVYDGAGGVWHADGQSAELGAPMTSRLTSPPYTVSQAGVVRLSFSHRWSFEFDGTAWDGGQVRVSVNGGPYTTVTAFNANGYNGSVAGNSASALSGQSAFISTSAGHGAGTRLTSSADLANLNVGDTVSVQFMYAADTNTRGAVPNWEIDSVALTQGGGLPVFVQWQRNNGTGYKDIAGGFGNTYSFTPNLADNGAKFRALVSQPGTTCINSSEATLTVNQMNTAPKFDVAAGTTSNEDDATQTRAGFVSNISAHSITRTPVQLASSFDNANGVTLYGSPMATVADGALKLTLAHVNSAYGAGAAAIPGQNYESIEVNWKSYVGNGDSGADGYSLNIGDDLAGDPGYGGEEGKGQGLIVTVDTFDNGGGETGVDLRWHGAQLAFKQLPKDDDGTGNFLRKAQFVNAKLTVDAAGNGTVTYDGNTITAALPGWAGTGIHANRVMFWARTGGANDDQWIDDFDLKAFPFDRSSVESGQAVTFLVSNDNPGMFDAQPAISPNGTLTYKTAANACGHATVTVRAHDDGGTACNGTDTSDPKTFTIDVNCVNDCPVATPQGPINAVAGIPRAITLTGTDADGDALTASIASNPSHGTLSVIGGVLNYTANAGYQGPDSFTFKVSDGTCTSVQAATVTLSVIAGHPPHCVASISPSDCGVTFPNNGKLYAIASTDGKICLALNGSGSSDPDPGDHLTMTWIIDGTNTLSGAVVTTCLKAGCHTIVLNVSDGTLNCQQQLDVCVVTPSEMVEQLITLVENTQVSRNNKRPLIVSLKAAKAAFESDGWSVGGQMLAVFQHKVKAQISRNNPAEAAMFDAAAGAIIRAIQCTTDLPNDVK